jgi:hypothetical protein
MGRHAISSKNKCANRQDGPGLGNAGAKTAAHATVRKESSSMRAKHAAGARYRCSSPRWIACTTVWNSSALTSEMTQCVMPP